MSAVLLEEIIKIQPKGVITIPKNIRGKYGLEDSSFVRIAETGRGIYLEPVRVLPYPVRSYTSEEIAEFIDFDKKLSKNSKHQPTTKI